jgi:hypothetical protein
MSGKAPRDCRVSCRPRSDRGPGGVHRERDRSVWVSCRNSYRHNRVLESRSLPSSNRCRSSRLFRHASVRCVAQSEERCLHGQLARKLANRTGPAKEIGSARYSMLPIAHRLEPCSKHRPQRNAKGLHRRSLAVQASALRVAGPTGFDPAISTLTGWRGRPGSSTGP